MAHAGRPPTLPSVDILLIEDNPAAVRLFREALKAGNIAGQVSVLEKASDVVAFVQQEHTLLPQMIVLDSGVPGMSATESIARLRRLPGFATIPTFLFSSLDEHEGQRRSALCGTMGFVHKPGDVQSYFNAILAMVYSEIEQTASLQQLRQAPPKLPPTRAALDPAHLKEERNGDLNLRPSTAELIARAQLVMQEARCLRDTAHAIKAACRRTMELTSNAWGENLSKGHAEPQKLFASPCTR